MTLRDRYKKMPWGGMRVPRNTAIPVTYHNSTYDVNPDTIREIASNSKGQKVDPYTAVAIAYQESGVNEQNPYHLNPQYFGQPFGNASSGVESIRAQLNYANSLQSKGTIPQGEDYTLQGYNGYGTISRGHADLEGANKIYGQPIPQGGLNLRKNPLYGKRVIDIRDNVIRKNPQVVSEIENAIPLYKPKDLVIKNKKAYGGRILKPFLGDPVPKDTTKVPMVVGEPVPGLQIPDETGDSPIEKERLFMQRYIQSPKYKERLVKQGYSNPEETIKRRLRDVTSVKAEYKEREGNGNSYYNAITHNIELDAQSADEGVGAHEVSHSVTEKLFSRTGLNGNDVRALRKGNKSTDPHDSRPTEFKADIDGLRYLLRKDKIYDASTQDFSPEILRIVKKKYANNYMVQDLLRAAKSDEDLIYLMNTVAKNKSASSTLT